MKMRLSNVASAWGDRGVSGVVGTGSCGRLCSLSALF